MATRRLPSEVFQRRLATQWVTGGEARDPAAVVSWLGALQSQDYLAGLWAIGLRAKAVREEDVEASIRDRKIVRTWPMRGTLHFVAADDARWMTELLAPRRVTSAKGRLHGLGIDRAVLARARRTFVRHLEGGRVLTRPAAFQALERGGVSTSGQRGIHILWCLAQECFLCFGPREGKQHTVVLFQEWLPRAPRLPRDEALGEIAFRYFRGHGPATVRDLARWAGLSLTDARHAVTLAGRRIASEDLAGETHWFTGAGAGAGVGVGAVAHALPAFDELLVGYADRSAALSLEAEKKVVTGGLFRPFVLQGGRVVATWSRRFERDEVVCTMEALEPLPRTARIAAQRGFERYAAFVGKRLRPFSG
ncbi:MAG: winged helix DNA-binding domain-containing protein [Polyangiaceae bacterium]